MVSEFRKKKYMELFKTFDSDSSGTIEKKDIESAASEIAQVGGKLDEGKRKECLSALLKVWEGLVSQANPTKDGHVSADEWVAVWDAYAKNPAAAAEWQNLYLKFTFQLYDCNKDGSITSDDFVKAYKEWQVKEDVALKIFQKVAKGTAEISFEDYQVLWREYFASDDVNAPGNHLFMELPA